MENDSRKMANWNGNLRLTSCKSIYAYMIIRGVMKLKALLQK